jgi:hypothetical protein
MFLSDFTIFSRVSANYRDGKFKDENDPEVDRLYNSSPTIMESSTTYEVEDRFKSDVDVRFDFIFKLILISTVLYVLGSIL